MRMQDVAARAGVSIATVSFVINATKPVSPETRAKVLAAMDDLGFRRNTVARALASGRSRIIALLFPELDRRLGSTALGFVRAAAAAAALRDHHVVLWPVDNEPAALRGYLDGGLVDGVLAMEVQLDDPRIAVLEDADMPFTLIGRTASPDAYEFVDIDFESTTVDALARLRSLGHRRIALVLEEPEQGRLHDYGPPARVERTYRTAMAAAGLPPVVLTADREQGSGRALAARLVAAHPEITAVAVMHDDAAPGLVAGLARSGRSVPERMSVLSLATTARMAGFADPELDRMEAPGAELGGMAADALIDRIEQPDRPLVHALITCRYVPGGSLAPPLSNGALQ